MLDCSESSSARILYSTIVYIAINRMTLMRYFIKFGRDTFQFSLGVIVDISRLPLASSFIYFCQHLTIL